MIWFLLGPYLLALVICCRMVAGHMAWAIFKADSLASGNTPGPVHWTAGLLLGLIVACLWPLALLFAAWPIKIGLEREAVHSARLAERDEIIARYEREMDPS